MRLAILAILATGLTSVDGRAQSDTLFTEVGSPMVDARVFKPHAARVRIYRGDSLVAQWLNELHVGDSAGRPVNRWVTTGEAVPLLPNRVLNVLRQTYDGITMAPRGYNSQSSSGAWISVSIDGKAVRGRRRTATDTTIQSVELTLDRPGFFQGASDLVPIATGQKTGTVIVAPMWSPNVAAADDRVFAVKQDTTLMVEGTAVVARKVEERRRSDGSLYANWYLLTLEPYMVYGEIPLPDGRVQRMTEVGVPLTSR
jgi:hypothetical protein